MERLRTPTASAARITPAKVELFGKDLERFRRDDLPAWLKTGKRGLVAGKFTAEDFEQLRQDQRLADEKKALVRVRAGTTPRWDRNARRWRATLEGRQRGRGRPAFTEDPSLGIVEFTTSGGRIKPTVFLVDDGYPERRLERERHLLLLRAEFVWILKWLDRALPRGMRDEPSIRRFLEPIGWTPDWDFARYIAKRRSSGRRWPELAARWIYRIERSREPDSKTYTTEDARFAAAELFVDDIEKRVRRADRRVRKIRGQKATDLAS